MVAAAMLAAGLAFAGEPLPGQIVADPGNRSWLVRHGEGPFFMCGPGDPEDFLYRGKLNADGTRDGDQEALIRKLAATGANSIYLMAVRSHGGDGDTTHNPFVGHDPARGLNEKVLDQWEGWFAEMDRQGIVIFFFFYDDESAPWSRSGDPTPAEARFIRALVDRFEHHRHLIWAVAEEYSETLSAKQASSIAALIREADDHDHAIAVHKLHGLRFEEFANDPNVDQFAIQYNEVSPRKIHDGVLTAWRRAGGRYNLNMSEAKHWGRGFTARRKMWAAAMAGAYVMVLDMDIANTPKADMEACGRLVDFMESTPFQTMQPRDDLAGGDARYVMARLGVGYLVYADSAGGPVGLKQVPAGVYRLRWLDIRGGQQRETVVQVPADGAASWPRPEGIGRELALYVMRVGDVPTP